MIIWVGLSHDLKKRPTIPKSRLRKPRQLYTDFLTVFDAKLLFSIFPRLIVVQCSRVVSLSMPRPERPSLVSTGQSPVLTRQKDPEACKGEVKHDHMSQSLVRNTVHLIFSTKHRQPLIKPDIEPELHAYLFTTCKNLECQPIRVGGDIDHVHILCALSKKMTMMKLLELLKAHSSR